MPVGVAWIRPTRTVGGVSPSIPIPASPRYGNKNSPGGAPGEEVARGGRAAPPADYCTVKGMFGIDSGKAGTGTFIHLA